MNDYDMHEGQWVSLYFSLTRIVSILIDDNPTRKILTLVGPKLREQVQFECEFLRITNTNTYLSHHINVFVPSSPNHNILNYISKSNEVISSQWIIADTDAQLKLVRDSHVDRAFLRNESKNIFVLIN
jgi:hypothetical protein